MLESGRGMQGGEAREGEGEGWMAESKEMKLVVVVVNNLMGGLIRRAPISYIGEVLGDIKRGVLHTNTIPEQYRDI